MSKRSGPVERFRRAAPIAIGSVRAFGSGVVHAGLAKRRGTDPGEAFHAHVAQQYADVLGHSKGAMMKIGQILSFVSPELRATSGYEAVYQAAFAKLQSSAPALDPGVACSIVEKELGSSLDQMFSAFDAVPFAVASIGQVHSATMLDGRKVAVKVQFPGVAEAIRADLSNAELVMTILRIFMMAMPRSVRLDLRSISDEIRDRVLEELDYRNEAANQTEFANAYKGHPFIHVPEIVPSLCGDRVLTMDLVEGMNWGEALNCHQDLKDGWGEVIWRFVFGSLRRLHLFNADPHPGNYLFHEDGRVTFLDFGCVKRFSDGDVNTMTSLVRSAVGNDAKGTWDAFRDMGFIDPADAPNPNDLLEWYRIVLAPMTNLQPYTYTSNTAAEVVRHEFDLKGPWNEVTRRFNVPKQYVFLTRVDLGLAFILGELRATGYWDDIDAELRGDIEAVTRIGEAEQRFWTRNAI